MEARNSYENKTLTWSTQRPGSTLCLETVLALAPKIVKRTDRCLLEPSPGFDKVG